MKKIIFMLVLIISSVVIKAESQGGFVGAGDDVPGVDYAAVLAEDDEDSFTTGLSDLSQSIAVFKNTAITDSSAITADDLLNQVPGIYINKSEIISMGSGIFAPSVLKIRGLGGSLNSGILTVIDGRPQSMGVDRNPLFESIDLDSIESMEVIKGPGGVLYGNQAVAGVINIKTKKRDIEGGNYSIGTMIGSHFTQDHFINAYIKKDEIDIGVSGSYSSAGGARVNSDNYMENMHAHAGYEIQKDLTASFNIDYNYSRDFNPGPTDLIWPRDAQAYKAIQRDGDFRLDYKMSDYNGSTMLFADTGSNKFLLNAVPPGFNSFVTGEYSQYENYGLRIMNEWVIFPGNSTKAGFDWVYFGGYYSSPLKEKGWNENDYAPYVSLSQEIGIFGISAGVRYEINSAWGMIPIRQAGFKISLFDQQSFYVNVSEGFKTPAMGEWVINSFDNLDPENFWQYEVGATQTLFERVSYNISVYQTEGANILQIDPVDGKLKNTGFILLRGVDADVSGKFLDIFKAGFIGSYVNPRDKTAHMAYISGSAYLKADIMKKLGIKLSADFAKDRFDADKKQSKLGDYTVLNVSVDYKTDIFGNDASFYLDVDNMFDNRYEVEAGYPATGFLIKGGLVIKL